MQIYQLQRLIKQQSEQLRRLYIANTEFHDYVKRIRAKTFPMGFISDNLRLIQKNKRQIAKLVDIQKALKKDLALKVQTNRYVARVNEVAKALEDN